MTEGFVNPRFAEMIDSSSLADTGGIAVDPFEAYDNSSDVLREMVLENGQVVRVNQEGYLETKPDGQYRDLAPSADDGYLAVNPDWLEEQWKLLSDQPWFRGDPKYRREDADAELLPQNPGTFVVRVSFSQPGHYAISAKSKKGHVHSMLILPSWAGPNSDAPGRTVYRLGSTSKLIFNTIVKLVKYYSEHNYYECDRLVGEIRPENQKGGYLMVKPGDLAAVQRAEAAKGIREPKDGYMVLAGTKTAYLDPSLAGGRRASQVGCTLPQATSPGDGGYLMLASTNDGGAAAGAGGRR